MELTRKTYVTRAKNFASMVSQDNLFLLSSSISYYSALALAPFLLILLAVASLIGENMQNDIVKQISTAMSPQVGQMIGMIFANVNKIPNVGSVSGIIGALVLLSTASMVFMQFRYSFDVLYGYYNPKASKGIKRSIFEKLFAMFFVLMIAISFIASIVGSGIFMEYFGGEGSGLWSSAVVLYVNFMIYLGLFTAVHHFVPTRRYHITETLKKATLSASFFMIGNFLLSLYLRRAGNSVYGAAASLLVFLTWTYYSSFIIFLSVDVFQYLKKIGKVK